ncbi:CAP domain-containing protein [Algoriphagus sp. AK58]|uniref:CAP domain-containing protein n=1 Tax=Algoriphagus sp. AK58 TaxID=1406877 RepID=UPI00164FBC42|nr:CAP domain-containing protein [Algoriphagus sp. AK58]MBC6367842.1 CAP domain-containing protein [Algoriphagus sp. AK58]
MHWKLFLLLALTSSAAFAQLKPDSSLDHYQLTSAAFFKSQSLHQAIDFKKVDYSLLQAAIFFFTNEERIKAGLPSLRHSKESQLAANGHAQDMVSHNFFSHTSPIRFRRTLRDRLNRQGTNPKYIGENIISLHGIQYQEGKKIGKPTVPGEFNYLQTSRKESIPPHTYYSFAQKVVQLWMNSPGHRQNILNPLFTHLGCGAQVYFDSNFYQMPYFMAVQNFIGK